MYMQRSESGAIYFFRPPEKSAFARTRLCNKATKERQKNESRLAPTLNFSVLAIDNMVQEVVASLTTREIVWFWLHDCPDY